jgi:hypothetical protein
MERADNIKIEAEFDITFKTTNTRQHIRREFMEFLIAINAEEGTAEIELEMQAERKETLTVILDAYDP